MPGIGHRLDGWPNRDLNIGAIIAAAPDLSPFATMLQTDVATVKKVVGSWGPGKFDAQLNLDGPSAVFVQFDCRWIRQGRTYARGARTHPPVADSHPFRVGCCSRISQGSDPRSTREKSK
jgi:hypothetical protein